jgi:hypothetical protein
MSRLAPLAAGSLSPVARLLAALGLLLCLFAAPARADDGDDTLRAYLAKSDVVLLGEFTSEPESFVREAGMVHYQADFKIAQLLKGKPLAERRVGGTIKVNVVRAEFEKDDRLPELEKGGRCILFLKCNDRQPTPSYITVDLWFGVQRAWPTMAKSLARLAAENAGPPAKKEKTPSDDERLKLLKPEMTFEEISALWRGKKSLGQTCGEGVNLLTGDAGGAYGEVYEWKPAGVPKLSSLKVGYFQGKDRPYEVRGPGFRYYLKDGKYVAADAPDAKRPAPAGEKYAAYWLTTSPVKDRGEYPVLLLARLPIEELAAHAAGLNHLYGKKPEEQPPLLDAPALTITTYRKDSIWNADRAPLKAVRSVENFRPKSREVTVNGVAYTYEDCPLTDVVRLLERPEGTKSLHRLHAPLSGAKQTARALLLVLKDDLEGPKPLPGGRAPLAERVKACKGAVVATLQEIGTPELGPPGAADYKAKWRVEKVLRGEYPKTADLSFRAQSIPRTKAEKLPTVGLSYILVSRESDGDQIAVILEADAKTLREVQDLLKQ